MGINRIAISGWGKKLKQDDVDIFVDIVLDEGYGDDRKDIESELDYYLEFIEYMTFQKARSLSDDTEYYYLKIRAKNPLELHKNTEIAINYCNSIGVISTYDEFEFYNNYWEY